VAGAGGGRGPALFDEEPARRIRVTMRDIRFETAELALLAGTLVSIELVNEGSLEHNFSVDRVQAARAYRISGEPPGSANRERCDVHVRLRPSTSAELRLRVERPGESRSSVIRRPRRPSA